MHMCVGFLTVAAVSELEANREKQGEGNIVGALNTFLRNARNCGSRKIKGAWNCGYARMEKLTCAVFRVFLFGGEVFPAVQISLLFLRWLLFF